MPIKTMMNEIIKKGKVEDMVWLGEVTCDAVYELKHTKPMWYHNIEIKMHERAYGNHLTTEQVKCITAMMSNKDGSVGEHWDYDKIQSLYITKNLNCDLNDFYFLMNYTYAKHYQRAFSDDIYIELTKDTMHHENILDIYYRIVRASIKK